MYFSSKGATTNNGVTTGSGNFAYIRLVRRSGETDAATADDLFIGLGTSPNLPSTPEKSNTRSSNPLSTGDLTVVTTTKIKAGLAAFSHGSWIAHPRFPIVIDASTAFANSLISGSTVIGFEEAEKTFGGRRMRRTTKPGYSPFFGSQIAHYQKTGGGAYSIKAPNFDNDIMWLDPTAWRNGMAQSDVWNINLFSAVARRRINVT